MSMSVAEALSTLPPEVRAILESQLKKTATARVFEHVGNSQYYNQVTTEGQTRNVPSGIPNPNTLKISHDTKAFGKRSVGLSFNRGRDGKIAISNAAFFPVRSLALSKDGALSITVDDTFNAKEVTFITGWMKSKYAERPASTETTTVSTPEVTTEAPTPAPASTAPSVVPADIKIKAALLKAKVKPSDENISLVKDLISQGGETLESAVASLAS